MVPTSDFSGLISSAWALASAAAITPIDSLDLCTPGLRGQNVKAHRSRFRTFGADAVPDCLFCILWHEPFELSLGILMLKVGLSGALENAGELRPGV